MLEVPKTGVAEAPNIGADAVVAVVEDPNTDADAIVAEDPKIEGTDAAVVVEDPKIEGADVLVAPNTEELAVVFVKLPSTAVEMLVRAPNALVEVVVSVSNIVVEVIVGAPKIVGSVAPKDISFPNCGRPPLFPRAEVAEAVTLSTLPNAGGVTAELVGDKQGSEVTAPKRGDRPVVMFGEAVGVEGLTKIDDLPEAEDEVAALPSIVVPVAEASASDVLSPEISCLPEG